MTEPIGYFSGYPIFVSDKPDKKYYALVRSDAGNARRIYFGDSAYQQYHDIFGYWKSQDHGDPERRRLYRLRHKADMGRKGSAGWFAANILW